jgi:hypothetical protein
MIAVIKAQKIKMLNFAEAELAKAIAAREINNTWETFEREAICFGAVKGWKGMLGIN